MVFKAYNFKSLKYDLPLVVFQNISREVFKDSHITKTREKFLLLRPITTEGNRVMYQSEFQTITCITRSKCTTPWFVFKTKTVHQAGQCRNTVS